MKIFLKIIVGLSLIIMLVLLGAFALLQMAGYQAKKELKNFKSITNQVSDGNYHGSFATLGQVKAEIEFRIAKGKMTHIRVLQLTGTPGYGADYAVQMQLDNSRMPDFDAATGATITSNFAKAAIKDALEKGTVK